MLCIYEHVYLSEICQCNATVNINSTHNDGWLNRGHGMWGKIYSDLHLLKVYPWSQSWGHQKCPKPVVVEQRSPSYTWMKGNAWYRNIYNEDMSMSSNVFEYSITQWTNENCHEEHPNFLTDIWSFFKRTKNFEKIYWIVRTNVTYSYLCISGKALMFNLSNSGSV